MLFIILIGEQRQFTTGRIIDIEKKLELYAYQSVGMWNVTFWRM